MRLIDADALVAKLEADAKQMEEPIAKMFTYAAINDVKHAPTVDAVPVKHGEWIWDDDGYHCSVCWYHAYGCTDEVFSGDWKFCSRCGARMAERREGDE